MNKILFCLASVVLVFTVIFHSDCQAVNVGQQISLDTLKSQFLPKEFQTHNFTIDELKKIYREKCKKAVGVDNSTLYKEIEKGAGVLMNCLSGLANLTSIQEEIEIARPTGELDTVFHKHCLKAPKIEKCILDFNDQIQPCLSVAERRQNAVLMRIFTGLLGFMCTKGGDQLALFVAEEGPECLEANKEAIGRCANSSFAKMLPKDAILLQQIDLFNLPDLVLAPEHCLDFDRFEACTIHHLEQCREITPANVAQAVFKYINNQTNCHEWKMAKASQRSVLKDADSSAVAWKFEYIAIVLGTFLLLVS